MDHAGGHGLLYPAGERTLFQPHLFRKFSRLDSENQGAVSGGPGLGVRFTFTIPSGR